MSFDSIPDALLVKVFHRLPFKDCVRLRGVSQLFNEISIRSINTIRSLEINDDLEAYLIYTQTFMSLLESCSFTLESINIHRSCSKRMLSALTEFAYPKLEHLKITVTNNELTKMLISRNRNLRSVTLYLSGEFEWPEDIVFEKLEDLEIHSSKESKGNAHVNLSPTLRPLINMVPNLKRLWIEKDPKMAPIILSVQELKQLSSSAPYLETLHLRLFRTKIAFQHNDNPPHGPFLGLCLDFVAAVPTWHMPKLTYLFINLKYPIPSSILQHFSTSSPQLKTIGAHNVIEIDDQTMEALSKLKHLREFYVSNLEITTDKFSKLITLLPSITGLQFKKIDPQSLPELPQLQHLSVLHVHHMEMTKAEIIDVIISSQTLTILAISEISDAGSFEMLVDFVTSTAALFHRNLEIRFRSVRVNGNEPELKAVLEDIEKNGGPVVQMDSGYVHTIQYKSLD